MSKLIIGAVVLVALIAGILFYFFGARFFAQKQTTEPITLTYWGLWEDDQLIKPAIAAYQQSHPNVTINYVRQSSLNYRTRLQTQLRNGQGPDIFRIHNSWVPMFGPDISVAPSSVITQSDFSNTFYPVAKDTLTANGKIYALPIEIDGLVLFYNEDLLRNANVAPPTNWKDFIEGAKKMTVADSAGRIQTAGAALGTTNNVDHWPDIVALLFLQQPNGNLAAPNNQDGQDAIKFYTSFITDPAKKTWDQTLDSSTMMFAQNRLAYYFAPSWRAHELRQANPTLKFKTVAVPQLPGRNVAWATFWAETVSNRSQHPDEAWEFVKYLVSAEAQKLLYQQQSKVRLFGEPYSRIELAPSLANDPLVGSVVLQGNYYKSWYLNSRTFDNGINDEMIKYYEDAVNASLSGQSLSAALETTSKGVKQILEKYTRGAPDINK